jgi:hypothetical protein
MMRLFGSSAPAIGAGPAGQLDAFRVPARTAAAKLMASFFPRPAASLGTMLSAPAGSPAVAETGGVGAASADVVATGGVAVEATESAAALPSAATGAGVDDTSPPLTPERGASATQAVRMASERTLAREKRTGDM